MGYNHTITHANNRKLGTRYVPGMRPWHAPPAVICVSRRDEMHSLIEPDSRGEGHTNKVTLNSPGANSERSSFFPSHREKKTRQLRQFRIHTYISPAYARDVCNETHQLVGLHGCESGITYYQRSWLDSVAFTASSN